MDINYSVPLNLPVNSSGAPLQSIPELIYGNRLDLVFTARDVNNAAVDLSAAATWSFAIDLDRAGQTLPLCSTGEIAYDATEKTLSCSVSARTLIFLEAVNGKSQVALIAEMSGFDGSGNRIFRFPWNMTGVMPVDANDIVPDDAPTPVALQDNDFTAFRVYADDTDDHTQTHAVGSYCPQFVPANILFRRTATGAMPDKLRELYQNTATPTEEQIRNALGYIGGRAIPKSMTERFVLLAPDDWAESDVAVDWGDGTRSLMKNGKTQIARGEGFYDSSDYLDDSGENFYMFSHTYEQAGEYYIKITGKDYWGIRHTYGDLKDSSGNAKYPGGTIESNASYNLLYDCLGNDTPVAGCVRDLSNFVNCGLRLLHMFWTANSRYVGLDVRNWALGFSNCRNLVSVRGAYFSGYGLAATRDVGALFQNCIRLEIFAGTLPAYCDSIIGYRSIFYDCAKLRANIAHIIPSGGFLGRRLGVAEMFKGCSNLTGTVPANLLWGDTGIVWSNTANTFSECSAAIRAQVPESWGGTLSE